MRYPPVAGYYSTNTQQNLRTTHFDSHPWSAEGPNMACSNRSFTSAPSAFANPEILRAELPNDHSDLQQSF